MICSSKIALIITAARVWFKKKSITFITISLASHCLSLRSEHSGSSLDISVCHHGICFSWNNFWFYGLFPKRWCPGGSFTIRLKWLQMIHDRSNYNAKTNLNQSNAGTKFWVFADDWTTTEAIVCPGIGPDVFLAFYITHETAMPTPKWRYINASWYKSRT